MPRKSVRKIRRSKAYKGGDRMSDSNIPFDTQYHRDMSKAQIRKHIAQIDEELDRNAKLLQEANQRINIEQQHENKKQEIEEQVDLQNKPHDNLLIEQKFQHRFNSISSFIKYLLDNISWFFKQGIDKIWDVFKGIGDAFVRIITVETVVSIIAYIFTLYIIGSFIFGYAISMPTANINVPPFMQVTSTAQGKNNMVKLAGEKLNYITSQNPLQQMQDFLMNIPQYFSNALITLRNIFAKINRVSGNDSAQKLFTKDRQINQEGRWDNVYNMELGKLVANFDNIENRGHIYSIIKPSSLDMHLSATGNKDLEQLPSYLKSNITQGKDKLTFNWELDRRSEASGLIKYKMDCNPVDATNQKMNLFKEAQKNQCSFVEIPFTSEDDDTINRPKYYDEETRRYSKNAIDMFVS